jgi:hypothetical protein
MKNNNLLISGAVVFRDSRKKRQWLIVKNDANKDWEIPKVTVRKGESSVRAVIRMIGEVAAMTIRILEEASRASGAAIINGKSVPVKYFYYLMIHKSGSEMVGFDQYAWVELAQAIKKVGLKREKDAFRSAKEILKEREKTRKKNKSTQTGEEY